MPVQAVSTAAGSICPLVRRVRRYSSAVRIIYVPYHLDEHLPDLDAPLPPGAAIDELAADLPEADVWSRLAALYDVVAGAVERTVRGGTVPAVVSGDCTVSIGMAAGLQRAGIDPSIVWFDAHGDVQTLETTSSGYLGGMALRFLVGYRPELLAQRIGLRPPPEARVLLVDARDLDPAEVHYLESVPMRRLAIDELSADSLPAGPLLLNLDLDIVDPTQLPGLRYPAADGPDISAVLQSARTVFDTGRVAALNVACTWQPGHADPDRVREHLVAAALAGLRGSPG
jgi:arginase